MLKPSMEPLPMGAFTSVKKPVLEATQTTGEFENWGPGPVSIYPGGQAAALRWINKNHIGGATAEWQIWSQPPPVKYAQAKGPTAGPGKYPIRKGDAGSAAAGHSAFFTVSFEDFVKIWPLQARSYWVRVWYPQTGITGVVSNTIEVVIQPESAVATLGPLGFGLGEFKEPHSVTVRFDHLNVVKASEGKEDEYLMLFVLYADGTTVDALNFPGSSVRVWSASQTHGNVSSSGTVGISKTTTVLPIGVEAIEQFAEVQAANITIESAAKMLNDSAIVVVIGVGMEADNTSTGSVNAARDELRNQIAHKANGIVQGVTLAKAQDPQFFKDLESKLLEMQGEIKDKVVSAAKSHWLGANWSPGLFNTLGLIEAANPDDYVGMGYAIFRYGELKAGQQAFSIRLNENPDHPADYELKGVLY